MDIGALYNYKVRRTQHKPDMNRKQNRWGS